MTTLYENFDDEELVKRAQHGDKAAFDTLIERHTKYIKAVARKNGPIEDVDDILQDVSMKALGSLKFLERPSNFKSWITSITRNTSIDYGRKKTKQRQHLLNSSFDLTDEYASDTQGFETEIEMREDNERIRELLREKVNENCYNCYILRDYGYKVDEIAAMLKLKEGSVRVYLSTANNALREFLEELRGE